jgi:U3 small nucleolar RNA-associated protein MPP10
VLYVFRHALKNVPDDVTLLDDEMEDAVNELLGEGSDSSSSSSDDDESEDHQEDARQTKPQGRKGARASAPTDEEFTEADYDIMLAEAASGSRDEEYSSEHGDETGHEEMEEGEAAGELLPAEDDFLRLADMEAFVHQAEAAEELGDRGGLSSYSKVKERLEGAQGGKLGGVTAAQQRRRLGEGQAEEESESEAGSGSDIDLLADMNSESDDERGQSGDVGAGITYEQFFGHRPGAARSATAGGNKGDARHVAAASDSGIKSAAGALVDTIAQRGLDSAFSRHELQTARIQEQIASMEEAAMRPQGWQFRGEASAGARPIDSALAVDLDYEQTLRPPPLPTVEASVALEDVIKARIRELRFDNVVRVEVAAPRKDRAVLQLEDGRSRAGLAEVYEEGGQNVHRFGGVSADQQARVLMV